jgi:hypothetical protein
MPSVTSPRDVIDAFERDNPGLSAEDVQFLDRLRSERYAIQVDTIWSRLSGANRADYSRVIGHAVKALRVANALPKVPAETDKNRGDLLAVKNAVRVIRGHCAKDHRAANLRRELARIEKEIESKEDLCALDLSGEAGITVALNSEELPRISRKYKTSAAQRATLIVQLRQALQNVFGKPCNEAIAAFTVVAFGTDTSADDVRNAWKRHIQRKT